MHPTNLADAQVCRDSSLFCCAPAVTALQHHQLTGMIHPYLMRKNGTTVPRSTSMEPTTNFCFDRDVMKSDCFQQSP